MLSTIPEIIEDSRQGKMFILCDDEDRENEGDLVIPAEFATPEVVNFMATHGRGLICLTLTKERVELLGLPFMASNNESRHSTPFTVSIEAREGISTGISAADRSHTIQTAIDAKKTKYDIVSPGHIFPLQAKQGGTLVRAGHTEASVDIARMAGCNPAGVICEIMNDDGTMARMPDLKKFAEKHNLKIATIADLIAYRRKHENLIDHIGTISPCHSRESGNLLKSIPEIPDQVGDDTTPNFEKRIYSNTLDGTQHMVMVRDGVDLSKNPKVRVHSFNFINDISDTSKIDTAKAKADVILFINNPKKVIYEGLKDRRIEGESNNEGSLRNYGIGAQILKDLGINKMVLLTSSAHEQHEPIALDGYDLEITKVESL